MITRKRGSHARRGRLLRAAQALGLGMMLAASVWAPAAQAGQCKLVNLGTMPVDMVGGRATTVVKINGKDEHFIIDTGGFYNFMSRAVADAQGLKLEMAPQGFYMSGVGGDAGVQVTHVAKFGLVDATLPNVAFIVGGSDLGMGLLGDNLLYLFDLELDLARGKASFMKPEGCGKASLAYWAPDGHYNAADLQPLHNPLNKAARLTVMVNGKPVTAELNTAATTGITRRAAERVGIDMALAKPAGQAHGIGSHNHDRWVARVASYQIGTETIQNSRMDVIDGDFGRGDRDPVEMELGVDFFLAHHVYIAKSQSKLYFSYNGGRPSIHDAVAELGKPAVAATDGKDQPQTAQAYLLRGQAHLQRGEVVAGRADLDKSIAMAPQDAASAPAYAARAQARLTRESKGASLPADSTQAALGDLDMALKLAPDALEPRLMRARLLQPRDPARAEADLAEARRLMPPGSVRTAELVHLYVQIGQPAKALPLLDAWLHLHAEDSNLGTMLNTRCWVRGLANTGLAEAQEDCRKAIRRDGPQAEYLGSQGLIQLRQGQYQAAIDTYTQALAKLPTMSWSRYGLGLARLHLGQEAGKADVAAALAQDPDLAARAAHLGLTVPSLTAPKG